MNDGVWDTDEVICMVTLARILPPLNKFECEHLGEKPEGGAISSMKVAVPTSVLEQISETQNLELIDIWVENEFGFPWIASHATELQWLSPEQYQQWKDEAYFV